MTTDAVGKIRFVKLGEHQLPPPSRSTRGAAGYDLMSREKMTVWPGQRKLVPTGYGLEMSSEFEAQVRPRSGLALKHGVTVLNSPGTIDSDYKLEVGVVLINHGEREFNINIGDRVAQLVFSNVAYTEDLVEAAARDGGFGSTGS